MLDLEWMLRGACHATNDNRFTADHPRTAAPVLVVCASCPVRTECGDYGTSTRQSGVWGGSYLNAGKPHRKATA